MVSNSCHENAYRIEFLTVFAFLFSLVVPISSNEVFAQVSYYQRIPHVCLKEATPRDNLWYTCINRPWWVDLKVGDEDKWVNDTGVPSPYEAVVRVDLVHAVGDYMQTLGSVGLNEGLTCVGDEKVEPVVCSGRITVDGSQWLATPAIYPIVFRGVDLASKGDDRWLMQQGQPPNQSDSEELCVGLETEGHCGVNGTIFQKDFKVFKATVFVDSKLPGTCSDNNIIANDAFTVNVGKLADVEVDLEPNITNEKVDLVLTGPVKWLENSGKSISKSEEDPAALLVVESWPGDDKPLNDYKYTLTPYWKGTKCGDEVEGYILKFKEKIVVLDNIYASNTRSENGVEPHLEPEGTNYWEYENPPQGALPVRGGVNEVVPRPLEAPYISGKAFGCTPLKANEVWWNIPGERYQLQDSIDGDWEGGEWGGRYYAKAKIKVVTIPPVVTDCFNVSIGCHLKWKSININCRAAQGDPTPPGMDVGLQIGLSHKVSDGVGGSVGLGWKPPKGFAASCGFCQYHIKDTDINLPLKLHAHVTSVFDYTPGPVQNEDLVISIGQLFIGHPNSSEDVRELEAKAGFSAMRTGGLGYGGGDLSFGGIVLEDVVFIITE